MKLLGIIEDDFINYKKVSMVLEFPYCSFKCNKEAGKLICQNTELINSIIVDYSIEDILDIYFHDNLSKAIICQGLEPLDSFDELLEFLEMFRNKSNDDFVIYTGYYLYEVEKYIAILKNFDNIIVKFGRFIEGHQPHFDEILGINLISDNQYSEKL